MAAYKDLRRLFSDDNLRNKVTTATIVAAHALLTKPAPTPEDRAWVQAVVDSPESQGLKVFYMVLVANKGATLETIQGVSDEAIQNAVNAITPQLVLAHAGL